MAPDFVLSLSEGPGMSADTPDPPFLAVIFTSKHGGQDVEEYGRVADRMIELAAQQDGYLGIESARSENGPGITVSYWRDEECINAWYRNAEHRDARRRGREKWYEHFHLRVAQVHRTYSSQPRVEET